MNRDGTGSTPQFDADIYRRARRSRFALNGYSNEAWRWQRQRRLDRLLGHEAGLDDAFDAVCTPSIDAGGHGGWHFHDGSIGQLCQRQVHFRVQEHAIRNNHWIFHHIWDLQHLHHVGFGIVRKSFSMIHVVPDRVLMWIGGSPSQLRESEIGDEGEALAGSAGTRVSNLSQSSKPTDIQRSKFNRTIANKRAGKDKTP